MPMYLYINIGMGICIHAVVRVTKQVNALADAHALSVNGQCAHALSLIVM